MVVVSHIQKKVNFKGPSPFSKNLEPSEIHVWKFFEMFTKSQMYKRKSNLTQWQFVVIN